MMQNKMKRISKKIRYIIIDVDGTLTDSGIYYDENGNEMKKFSTRDAAGFQAAGKTGIQTVILTGRICQAVERRMKELKADHVIQNVSNKAAYLKKFMNDNHIKRDEIMFIGDDLNDLQAMNLAGYVGCPKDSCEEVKKRADYVSPVRGGYGAVRDVIEHMLRETEEWTKAVSEIYGTGV